MGYFMRYILADARPINFALIGETLAVLDPLYSLRATDLDELVEVLYDDQLYGQIEIDVPGDELFDDDLSAFTEMLGETTGAEEQLVAEILSEATQILAVEMFWEGENSEATYARFDPLWIWLFANRRGVLQADSEGFYGASGLLAERKFML